MTLIIRCFILIQAVAKDIGIISYCDVKKNENIFLDGSKLINLWSTASVITLNVHELNTLIKIQRLSEWIKII